MRRYYKNQCCETLRLMKEAHGEIADLLAKGNREEAAALLEQCQNSAIDLGETIDRLEGEGSRAVKQLEEYCEVVYQMYQTVSGKTQPKEESSGWKLRKTLNRMADKAEDSIRRELPTQTEVLFLPYKASMWDSLESVWEAADRDPDCNALVIPIPYYDKNPDGSFRELHYEGNRYPKSVPVVDYHTYDFENRHPDIIYIHNPYDESNYVTSVHPFFYSSHLKELTEELVYIPYFVLGEIDPEDQGTVKGIAHLITTPGVIHADRVIVQSEAMRQIYINVMSEFAGQETRSYWEKKISGEGSPKLDKIRKLSREAAEIPQEWLHYIEKPDGSRKRIILYNTSVGALLHHNERMLQKMRSVFETFREHAEEVALLWRPHPLMQATLTAMRMELWEKYQELVQWYLENEIGIYDDTADIDRAIAISDAYYGDWSSVVEMCRKAELPVMIENVEII